MTSMARASTHGATAGGSVVNGLRTECMERAFSHGRMVASTMASITMIRSMGRVCLSGLTVVSMKEDGERASSMGSGHTPLAEERHGRASGRMDDGCGGFQRTKQ